MRTKWRVTAMLAGAIVAAAVAGCGKGNTGGGGMGGASGSGATVATVNGQAIDREELHRFLEATNGEQALQQLIQFQMVMQELKDQKMDVSDQEVSDMMAQRAKQSPGMADDIDKITKTAGPRLEALQRNIRYQIAIDK